MLMKYRRPEQFRVNSPLHQGLESRDRSFAYPLIADLFRSSLLACRRRFMVILVMNPCRLPGTRNLAVFACSWANLEVLAQPQTIFIGVACFTMLGCPSDLTLRVKMELLTICQHFVVTIIYTCDISRERLVWQGEWQYRGKSKESRQV